MRLSSYDRRQSQMAGFSQSAMIPVDRSGSASSVFQSSHFGEASSQGTF